MVAQDFPDRIYTHDGDTIECCITLVNDQSVFYYYMKKDIRRPDRVTHDRIKGYNWTKNCSYNFSDGQPQPYEPVERERKKWGYGVKFVQQFNMPALHSVVALNVRKGNHNLYVGPHFTHIAEKKIKGDADISYAQNTYGINMGYNIEIKTRNEIFGVFLQVDVSLYEAQYWYYNGPYSDIKSETKLVAENSLSLGLKYNASEKFELFGGYGIGSTDGFLFMLEGVVPHMYVGVQYNIK